MKKFAFLSVLLVLFFASCSTVREAGGLSKDIEGLSSKAESLKNEPEPSSLGKLEMISGEIETLTSSVESLYGRLIEKYPDNEQIQLSLGRFYYKRKDFVKARDILSKLTSKESRILLAKTYTNLADYTSSIDTFERLDDIEDDEALYLYGLSLEKKNLFPEAKDVYKKIKRPPYLGRARERLEAFKVKFEQSLPPYLEKILSSAPVREDFPNASSVVLLCDEKIRITKDNKSQTYIHVIVKVLNEKGRDEWGEVEVGYDSTYEKVQLEFARTISPSREIINAGKENIRDVSRYLNFPLYSNARAFIVSMPEVLKGSIIEYKVVITKNKLINKKDFSLIYRLLESQPILDCRFTLEVPKERDVFFRRINDEYIPSHITFKPVKSIKGDFCRYSLEFKNLPQFIPESNMVPTSFVNPALVISSFSDWSQFYKWWRDLYKDKISLDKDLKDFLNDLIEDADSEYEKAKKIYEFCAEKIRYVAIEYGDAGFEPHSTSKVFLNKYGDCKDQAILLVSLLRGSGIDAYPVLIPTKSAYNLEEERAASYFNHAIACARIDGDLVFMDPTASVTSFGDLPPPDQNRKVMVFFDNGYKILKTPLIKENFLYKKMNIELNEDEISKIQREVLSGGVFASSQRYYLRYTPPQLIEDDLQEKMRNISSLSKLEGFTTENADVLDKDPVLKYNFVAYNLLSKVQDLRILPVLGEEIVQASWINKQERTYPLYFSSPHRVEIEVKISLPKNLKVRYLPEDLEIESQWLDFHLTYEENDDGLIFREVMLTKKEIVKESDYSELKKLIEDILHNLKQQIILKKVNR